MSQGPISAKNLIWTLCQMRYGEPSKSHATHLKQDLADFRRKHSEEFRLSRQAINSWFNGHSVPTRKRAILFLSAYLNEVSRDALQTEAQKNIHDQVSTYLREQLTLKAQSSRLERNSLVHISSWMRQFFGSRRENIEFCKSIIGSYSLYFRSEDVPDHVVRGSMKFAADINMNDFTVSEHQEIRKTGAVEDWNGYYFARQRHIIIILRGIGQEIRDLPKFYIMERWFFNEYHPVGTTGVMVKIGSGRSSGGIFFSRILLRRDDDAISKCDVLPNQQVDEDILRSFSS